MCTNSFTGLSLVSGTSLDGLDIACVEFTVEMMCDIWMHRVMAATTIPYTDQWRQRLAGAMNMTGLELIKLHVDYAHFMGKAIQEFMEEHPTLRLNFVASHGHTVFHQPDSRLTFQVGDGETLATYLHWPLICNFRMKDVGLGGQGQPLASSVERFLFPYVALCLNLRGIASVAARNGKAWDVCACNIVINRLANMADPSVECDKDGQLASQGAVLPTVLQTLDKLDFYRQLPPKALSMEWINSNVWPILDNKQYSLPDLARTYVEHIALQVVNACDVAARTATESSPSTSPPPSKTSKVLITGGGAHNKTLMKEIERKLETQNIQIEQTDPYTIDYKEAIIFAFLGLRCLTGRDNVFADTTGARQDSISGSIHQPGLMIETNRAYRNSHFRFLSLNRQLSGGT